ncbi:MAG TPA: glycosyltransferase family 2 protein [Ktedonobacteraceae bacterium]|nr:glycosyltransferase family 2 protein [Ktedonobacteraceae bacterium]
MENKKPLYFLAENPSGWKRASLPTLQAAAGALLSASTLTSERMSAMPWSQRHEYLNDLVAQHQARRWEEVTSARPEDSAFTLIIPIHNEENSLPSFLGTLMLVDVPSTVPMQVIFVTNACNDLSIDILRAFLARLGNVELKNIGDMCADENIDCRCSVVKQGHLTFMHVNTSVAGKAHALGIGNRLARQSGHIIAMSADANNFMEPDALRLLFSHACRAFRARPAAQDVVLFSAVGKETQKRSRQTSVFGKTDADGQHLVEVGAGVVNGWMMAWNSAWMESIGGPPAVALEDYALGVLARASGFTIEQAPEVNVWGYVINNFKGLVHTRARYVRGKMQICEYVHHDPAVLSIIGNEAFYMKKFVFRLKYLLSKSIADPLHSVKYAATFLIWEYAIWKGVRDYRQNPTNQSWEKIEATY